MFCFLKSFCPSLSHQVGFTSKRLDIFKQMCLGKVLKITDTDDLKNKEVLRRANRQCNCARYVIDTPKGLKMISTKWLAKKRNAVSNLAQHIEI